MLYLIILRIIPNKVLTKFIKNKLFHIHILLGSKISMSSSNAMKQFCTTFHQSRKKKRGPNWLQLSSQNKGKFEEFGMQLVWC